MKTTFKAIVLAASLSMIAGSAFAADIVLAPAADMAAAFEVDVLTADLTAGVYADMAFAVISQTGDSNFASIVQVGTGNAASITQDTAPSVASVSQVGNHNAAVINQK